MAAVVARVKRTSGWTAWTRTTPALRSAVASSFPTSRSWWRIRKREVAPAALVLGLVHLEDVLEAEEVHRVRAVVGQAVEGRQQRGAPSNGCASASGSTRHVPGM